MRAGELTHRVQIQRRASGATGAGASTPGWSAVPSAAADGSWAAKLEPLSARELVAAATAQVLASHKVTTRFVEGLDASCRFLETRHGKTRVFHITSVIDVEEKHVWHECLVIEKVGGA